MKPLVIACHHKTGSALVNALVDRVLPCERADQMRIVRGDPLLRKFPLSKILVMFQPVDVYVNQWFEHLIDTPKSSVRLLHFARHPVPWVRSAYLYHRKGAPSDLVRWVDWKLFSVKRRRISYYQLLNTIPVKFGLAVESLRAFPEILAAARVSHSACLLKCAHTTSVDLIFKNFDAHIAKMCSFLGLEGSRLCKAMRALKPFDLSLGDDLSQGPHVTRHLPEVPYLENLLASDPLFMQMYGSISEAIGFAYQYPAAVSESVLPSRIINEIVKGEKHLSNSVILEERKREFMTAVRNALWWPVYLLQNLGCGHLTMASFIQEYITALSKVDGIFR